MAAPPPLALSRMLPATQAKRLSSVSLYFLPVLYNFLSALQHNRTQSTLIKSFHDKECIDFPTHSAEFSTKRYFPNEEKWRKRASLL